MFKLIYKWRVGESEFKVAILPTLGNSRPVVAFLVDASTLGFFLAIRSLQLNSGK